MWFSLGICILICYWVNVAHSAEVNWTEYTTLHPVLSSFNSGDNVNEALAVSDVMQLLRDLPISLYWDSAKASFRTSLIGEVLRGAEGGRYNSYLSIKPSKIMSNGKLISANITSVEVVRLYMDAIVVLQVLAGNVSQSVKMLTEVLLIRQEVGPRAISLLASLDNWSSTKCLEARASAAQTEVDAVDAIVLASRSMISQQLKSAEDTGAKKRAALEMQSFRLLEESLQQAMRLEEMRGHRRRLLEEAAMAVENEERVFQLSLVYAEANSSLRAIRQRGELNVAGVVFRAQEEGRLLHEGEAHAQELLRLEGEYRREGVRAVVVAVFVQVRAVFELLVSDYMRVLRLAAFSILLICIGITISEVVKTIHGFILSKLNQPSSTLVMTFKRAKGLDAGLLAEPHLSSQLELLGGRYKAKGFIPPLVLVTGGRGQGKTRIAAHIAALSGRPCCHVSCKDLLARGRSAALLLRRALSTHSGLLVLDDADEVLQSRDRTSPGAGRDLLYALLESGKGRPAPAIILATTLTPGYIDTVVLDRVDAHIQLLPPSHQTRAQFVSEKTSSIFARLLPAEELEEVIRFIYDEENTPDLKKLGVTGQGFSVMLMQALIASSSGWSFGELEQFFTNLQSRVLGTESCQLTAAVWCAELQSKLDKRKKFVKK